MNALVLAVAALLFSRLVASDRIEPYRLKVIGAIEKATDSLPNTLRLPVIVGGAVTLGAIIAYMPLVGVIVTFCALVLIIRYGKVTEDSKAILTELRNGSFSQAQIKLTEFSGTDASQLDENGVARISVETQVLKLAENVFIPLAWFALGGLPGILLYWTSTVIAHRHGSGETSERWVALLNWVPIRLINCHRTPPWIGRNIRALGRSPQLGPNSADGSHARIHGRSGTLARRLDTSSQRILRSRGRYPDCCNRRRYSRKAWRFSLRAGSDQTRTNPR